MSDFSVMFSVFFAARAALNFSLITAAVSSPSPLFGGAGAGERGAERGEGAGVGGDLGAGSIH